VQSTRHDANLAALHASTLPGYVLDVVVLTSDGGLLATLRDASSPEHAIWHAPSADSAVDFLVGGRCGILIADLGTLRADAGSLLARLHAQFPELVLMATGKRDEEAAVAALVSDGRIYRFLHKPISPARGSVFLGAATRRYYELRDTQPVMLSTVRTIARRPHAGKIAAAIVAGAIVAAVSLIWFFAGGSVSTPPLHAPLAEGPTQSQQIADLLGRARIAYTTGRLAEPRDDNAVEYYRAVLAIEPQQPEAIAGLGQVGAALERRVVAALQARSPAEGAVALTALQRAQPNHPRLEALQRELVTISRSMTPPPSVAERRTVNAPVADAPAISVEENGATEPEAAPLDEQTSQVASLDSDLSETTAAPPTETDELSADSSYADAMEQLALAVRLRERDMLIEPAGNNAFEYMQSLIAQYPDVDVVRAEQQRLAFRFLEKSRTALLAGELNEAARFLDRAEQLVPGMSTTQGLRAQLDSERAARELAESIVQAGALKRTREVLGQYPREAQLRGIEGWVDIEFTIAADGTPQDLVVRGAEPADVFERSALDALRRWRFVPIVRDGQAIAQRAILRMKYELTN
jgi:TonB family protein